MASPAILLLGDGDLSDEVRSGLLALGAEVVRLVKPTQREITEAFERGRIERVVVVSRDDALALRWALMVRDADAGVEMLMTYFDDATSALVEEQVGNCRVTSMARIAAPVLAGPLIDETYGALMRDEDGTVVAFASGADGERAERKEVEIESRRRGRALLSGLVRPHDRSAALLLYGALGLVTVLLVETITAVFVLDQSLVDAFYGSTKTLVTVDPNDPVADGPSWYKTFVSGLMLVVLAFEAFFTAGIVNRLIDRRLTGLWGSNAVPREHHVIVVGLGQVGLKLCLLLRECGVPVVAVDDDEAGENVGIARREGLPVVIGRGADPSVLARLSLGKALAVAVVADDDLQNLRVALIALSLCEDLRLVVRVGDGELANETRSLFQLGFVRDVHRIAGALIAAQAMGSSARHVICHDDRTLLVHEDGRLEEAAIAASDSEA